MGKRGPGAKPTAPPPPKRTRQKHPAWERKGLSRADRVIAFVESLKITAGVLAGQNMRLREWQKRIVRGIYDPVAEDGRRQVRTALITCGRKNGKTTFSAALALVHLVGPEAE